MSPSTSSELSNVYKYPHLSPSFPSLLHQTKSQTQTNQFSTQHYNTLQTSQLTKPANQTNYPKTMWGGSGNNWQRPMGNWGSAPNQHFQGANGAWGSSGGVYSTFYSRPNLGGGAGGTYSAGSGGQLSSGYSYQRPNYMGREPPRPPTLKNYCGPRPPHGGGGGGGGIF